MMYTYSSWLTLQEKIGFIKNHTVSMILYTEITVALVRKEKTATHRLLVEIRSKATILEEDNGQ